jgi:hypothetical protein
MGKKRIASGGAHGTTYVCITRNRVYHSPNASSVLLKLSLIITNSCTHKVFKGVDSGYFSVASLQFNIF